MTLRILLIEQAGESLQATLAPLLDGGAYSYQRLDWKDLPPDKLGEHPADLILPIALREPKPAIKLFEWVSDRPIRTPMLALLPNCAEAELLRSAAKAATDFMRWPAQPEEFAERVGRILGGLGKHSIRDGLCDGGGLSLLVGNEPAFVKLLAQIPRIARNNSPVLISGETGTGKELCARAIHHLGQRRDAPFIPVDCAAFPDHLFENELFGHVRGAYTDAHRDQKGLVALAEGGTLFLDEIDSLSPSAQAKLLRFLQERTYRPLGCDRFLRANVNVLAATNRDLELFVREQRFRSDLFFRLNVLKLHMPPLRERRGDIPLLARHFLQRLCMEHGQAAKILAPATLARLCQRDWPGNVRELANVVQRAFVFADGLQILPCHVGGPEAEAALEVADGNYSQARAQALEAFERQYLIQLLRQFKGNITQAARHAGKERRALGRLVKRHGIDCRQFY